MHLSPRRRRSLPLIALMLAGACHLGRSDSDTPPIKDADIVAIVLAANNTDLSYARLVPARTHSAAVTTFAQRMMTDHTILNNVVTEIANRAGLIPRDHPITLDFRDKSAARRDILRELEGVAFDSIYAANEVQYHAELLATIDGVLIPAARGDATLREFIRNLRPAVSAHLAHAEQLRAALASKKR